MRILIQNLNDFSENNRLERKQSFLLNNMNFIMNMAGINL